MSIDSGSDFPPPLYGDVCLRKQRRKRQKLLLTELFFDFAKNTTLHGLRYVTERGLTVLEKLFWFITFCASCALCFLLIRNVFIKWKTSPVIVTFSEQLVPVSMVPFPSVTICPQLKIIRSKYDYSGVWYQLKTNKTFWRQLKMDNLSLPVEPFEGISFEKLDDVSLVCGYTKTLLHRSSTNVSFIRNIMEVSPDLKDVFYSCSWHGRKKNCSLIMKKVLTSEGVCFNFNCLSASEIFHPKNVQNDYSYLQATAANKFWSLDVGYTSETETTYPKRGRENGASPDLEIILKENKSHRDEMCNILNRGYKIYLQHPADFPHDSLYYYAALPNQVSSLALKFNMLTTSKDLKGYEPEIRQCYFPYERPLRYFRIYTANNCILECQSNYTYRMCGCIWFNMPHDNSQSICTMAQWKCMIKAKDNLAVKGFAVACRCLPLCDSVQYDAEILKTEFDLRSLLRVQRRMGSTDANETKEVQYSKIEMYFKEPRFVSTRRSELFGLTDFLANCGGLLGLFLGFSFLSLVEIFYFLTLRVCCILRKDLRNEKKGVLQN